MYVFKVKYKKSGKTVEIEVEVSIPSLDAQAAARKIGVSVADIIAVRKIR